MEIFLPCLPLLPLSHCEWQRHTAHPILYHERVASLSRTQPIFLRVRNTELSPSPWTVGPGSIVDTGSETLRNLSFFNLSFYVYKMGIIIIRVLWELSKFKHIYKKKVWPIVQTDVVDLWFQKIFHFICLSNFIIFCFAQLSATNNYNDNSIIHFSWYLEQNGHRKFWKINSFLSIFFLSIFCLQECDQ